MLLLQETSCRHRKTVRPGQQTNVCWTADRPFKQLETHVISRLTRLKLGTIVVEAWTSVSVLAQISALLFPHSRPPETLVHNVEST